MASYSKVLLMGNITRDIELKYTQSNQAVAKIGIAVNRRYKGADGQMKEDVCFVDCDAWGKTAEAMSKYLSKGRPVFVEGHLRLDQWQDKEGAKHSKLKVVIENFQFIDSKPGGGGGGGDGYGGGERSSAPRAAAASSGNGGGGGGGGGGGSPAYEPIQEDDIPF